MVKIHFVTHDSVTFDVDAEPGSSLMEVARDNELPGIDGDCGGVCACATCHVLFDATAFALVGGPDDAEADMLELAEGVGPTSRLACRIRIDPALDGLCVTVPQYQR